MVYSTALSTTPSTSGVYVSTYVFDAKLDIMNIHTDLDPPDFPNSLH